MVMFLYHMFLPTSPRLLVCASCGPREHLSPTCRAILKTNKTSEELLPNSPKTLRPYTLIINHKSICSIIGQKFFYAPPEGPLIEKVCSHIPVLYKAWCI